MLTRSSCCLHRSNAGVVVLASRRKVLSRSRKPPTLQPIPSLVIASYCDGRTEVSLSQKPDIEKWFLRAGQRSAREITLLVSGWSKPLARWHSQPAPHWHPVGSVVHARWG